MEVDMPKYNPRTGMYEDGTGNLVAQHARANFFQWLLVFLAIAAYIWFPDKVRNFVIGVSVTILVIRFFFNIMRGRL